MRWRSITGARKLNERAAPPYYREGRIWLHGGPAELEGGRFARNMRGGRDMGGIFFVEESPEGWTHALGYASLRHRKGAIYRCAINLRDDDVFDLSQQFDRDWFIDAIGRESASSLMSKAGDGPMPWLRSPEWQHAIEALVRRAGYEAMIVQERGGSQPIISLCVFDPKVIRIMEIVPKEEAMLRYGKTPLGRTA